MIDPPRSLEEQEVKTQINEKKDWKTWLKTKLRDKLQDIFATIIIFAILIFLIILPLVFNFSDVKWYAKIMMIVGSYFGAVFLIAFSTTFSELAQIKRSIFHFSPLWLVFLLGIIAYFNFELWGYKSALIGLIFTWAFFIVFYSSAKMLFNKAVGSENTPIVLIAMAMLTLFIALVNQEEDNNASADLYYKISGLIIYLVAIAIYTNKYIYRKRDENQVISNIIGIIFWGAIITISFPFYVQWCGLTGDNLDMFVSVYSAVLGGGITLAGVAWTIRHTNKEKREDERKAIRPIIYPYNTPNPMDAMRRVSLEFVDQECKNYDGRYIGGIKNTDNGIFLVKELIVDNEHFLAQYEDVLDKNNYAEIVLYTNKTLQFDTIALIGTDVRGYSVVFNIELTEDKKEILKIVEA